MKRVKGITLLGWAAALTILLSGGTAFAQGGTVKGKVLFEGEIPAPKPLSFGAEKQCAVIHADKMPVNEELVVNPDRTVKWALVYVKEVPGAYPAPDAPALIDQTGCVFIPHALGVMAGQKVQIKNSDLLLHNVRSAAKINKLFNVAQPIQGMVTTKTFDQPEIGIQLRCDVHFWMTSYVHVLSHPFFAVTGGDGSFEIRGLPAGTYTLELWHEKLGAQSQSVTVSEGQTLEADFVLGKT